MNIKLLTNTAKLPARGTEYSAGFDLYADLNEDEVFIDPNRRTLIHTGVAVQIPHGCFGAVFARSGIAFKRGLRPANCVGVIDSDYTGEIMVAIHNDSDEIQSISNGERVAQLVIIPYMPFDLNVVDELQSTERGDGGFGHTGSM